MVMHSSSSFSFGFVFFFFCVLGQLFVLDSVLFFILIFSLFV